MKKEREEYLWWLDLAVTMVVMAMLHRAAKESWDSMGFFGFGALFLWLLQKTGFYLLLLGGIFLSLFRRSRRRGFLVASAVSRGLFLAAWFGLWNAIPSLWTWFETGCAALAVTLGAELIAGWRRKPGEP
ncbi:MAG: DUF4175 domain-containing protein [Oscillospiraceae bacterium]|nr:DUF4175 domain-containing protein [Oscillospiraceae bacterium]